MSFQEVTKKLVSTDSTIFTCPATQSGSAHGLVFSNISGAPANLTLKLFNQLTGLTETITNNLPIATSAPYAWPKPINMVSGDQIIAASSVDNAIVSMASIYLGPTVLVQTGFTPRGDWSSVATYAQNDVVHRLGSSYVAVTPSINSAPPSASWMVQSAKGDTGATGDIGATGAPGDNGNTIAYGSGAPNNANGVDGDTYIDTTAHMVYSPKAGGVWPTGTSLIGPQGTQGIQGFQGVQGIQGTTGPAGTDGNTVLYGTSDPVSGTGINGNLFINTTSHYLFGPKVTGAWPVGVSLVGPQGTQGVQGVQGTTGATGGTGSAGVDGRTVLSGTIDPAAGVGADGDFYLNLTTQKIFGPKASGTWPIGVTYRGTDGTGAAVSISDEGTLLTAGVNAINFVGAEVTATNPSGSSIVITIPGVTTTTIGIPNVENKSSATIRGELTYSNITMGLGFTPVDAASKGVADGVASLDSSGLIPVGQLPSYVDDVVEYANVAALPGTGLTGKIYITIDTNPPKQWRWTGSVYQDIVQSPGTTDALTEGSSNLYYTATRVWNQVLTGLSLVTSTVVAATDSILVAIGKLQAQITLRAPIDSASLTGTTTVANLTVTNAPTFPAATIAPGLLGSSSPTVVAAGANQTAATLLTSDYNVVTSGTGGVRLMAAVGGKYAVVVNVSGTAINVYPAIGHQHDGLGANNPILLANGSALEIFGTSTTQWYTAANMQLNVSALSGIVSGTNGGSGVNNGAFTHTLSGNVLYTGAFNPTFAIPATATYTFPAATDTLMGRASTDTITNKTYDTAGTGNVFKVNGTQLSAITGTGAIVLVTSPTLVTPVLGVAAATTINKVTITAPTTSATLTLIQGSTLATTTAFSQSFAPTTNVTLTMAGNLTIAGAFATTITATAATTQTLPAASDTLVGRNSVDTLANKTLVAPIIVGGPLDLFLMNQGII